MFCLCVAAPRNLAANVEVIRVQKQKFYGGKEYEEFFYPFLKRSGVFMLVIELG